MITVAGTLDHGYQPDVKKPPIKNFVMRAATIADAIAALDKAPADASNLTIRIYKAAEQMVSLGDLPKEAITAELLLGLYENDITDIYNAQDEVAKKLSGVKTPAATSSA